MSDTKVYEEIQHAIALRKSGKGFLEIRKHLEAKNYDEATIKLIIRKVDDDEMKLNKKKKEKEKAVENMVYGVGIVLFGLMFTLYTYKKAMFEGGGYVVTFGTILGGYVWFRSAWRKYNELKEEE